jgi:hypothetical protein
MQHVRAYKTVDGRVFQDRQDALNHEAGLELEKVFNDVFDPVRRSEDGAAVKRVLAAIKTDLDTTKMVRDALTRYLQRVSSKPKTAMSCVSKAA